MQIPAIVFSSEEYTSFADKLANEAGYHRGRVEMKRFPDGERYYRLEDEVTDRDVVVVGGTVSDAATMDIYRIASGAVSYGARRLYLVLPYFGYSTMERATQYGEVVTAKTQAQILSSIPRAGLGNHVLMLDLHSEGIPHYFDAGVHAVHVYGKQVVLDAARKLGGKDFAFAAADAGRAKWVLSLAKDAGVEAILAFKNRTSGSETEIIGYSGEVKGKHLVLYDDMIRTGGSILDAAQAFLRDGARRVDVITTHGVFSKYALAQHSAGYLLDNGIAHLVCTDSHSRAHELEGQLPAEHFTLASVTSLFLPHLPSNRAVS